MIAKIKKRLNMTVQKFRADSSFSTQLATLRMTEELGGRLGFKRLSKSAQEKKDQWILQYLQNKLQSELLSFKDCEPDGKSEEAAPVWVCWWTGEEGAPPLVRQCIRSIKSRAGAHPVHLITKDTYSRYITIPDYMLEKQQKGQITLAQLSDYIRVSLISEYGGLWLDATIYCAEDIPESYFDLPLFTCKQKPTPCGYVSQMQWTSFVLGGRKGQPLFRFMRKAFETYWASEEVLIDYLLVDYLILLGKQELPAVARDFERIPVNNTHRDDLQAAMNEALPAEEFDNVIKSDTVLYKLSWRETYSPVTADGKKSVYAAYLEREM